MKSLTNACLAAITLCGLLHLLGCAGATRMPMRSRGPAGASIESNQLDLTFLHPGTTTRNEVTDRLAAINTGYANPRLFWGRWSESKWGYWWFVTDFGIAGHSPEAAGNAARKWHVKNLLVTFDDKGVMQDRKLFDDDRALWPALHAELAQAPALDLSNPVSFPLDYRSYREITLTSDAIAITRPKARPPVRFSPLKVTRFSHGGTPDKKIRPASTCHTLHLSEKTAAGKNIHFCTDGPGVMKMFQYLHQAGPADLQWE